MHRGQLLGDLGRAGGRAAPHRPVRRARRGPRPGLGRAPDLDQPALADLHGRQLGRGPGRRLGRFLATEARAKGVDVLLGPTINLHRSPLGGRHFECFSEDPLLTARIGAAYVRGVQDEGVAATPKHYVANDSETERFTVDTRVGSGPCVSSTWPRSSTWSARPARGW